MAAFFGALARLGELWPRPELTAPPPVGGYVPTYYVFGF